MTKKLLIVVLAALAAIAPQGAHAVGAATVSSPSSGVSSLVGHRSSVDGNGAQFMLASDLGYKVATFTSDAANTAGVLADELGNTVSCGVVHQVCISDDALNANKVNIYDTSDITKAAYDSAKTATARQLMVPLWATDTTKVGQNCSPILDAQFNLGLAISQLNGTSGSSAIYWRPCKGGNN